jgi:hypothetical protein
VRPCATGVTCAISVQSFALVKRHLLCSPLEQVSYALAPTTEIRLMLAGVVYSILLLDWLAMLVAQVVVRWFSPLLLLLGVNHVSRLAYN